jgi:hypothetical protein
MDLDSTMNIFNGEAEFRSWFRRVGQLFSTVKNIKFLFGKMFQSQIRCQWSKIDSRQQFTAVSTARTSDGDQKTQSSELTRKLEWWSDERIFLGTSQEVVVNLKLLAVFTKCLIVNIWYFSCQNQLFTLMQLWVRIDTRKSVIRYLLVTSIWQLWSRNGR